MPNICSIFSCGSSSTDEYEPIGEETQALAESGPPYLKASPYLPTYTSRPNENSPGYSLVPARREAFQDWEVCYPSPSEGAHEQLGFYRNRGFDVSGTLCCFTCPISGAKPTSIYLAPHVLTQPWHKTGILTLDFDCTITKNHTFGSDRYCGYKLDAAGREANLRHPAGLRGVLAAAKAANVCVTIATRHDDMPHVLAYLQTLVSGIAPDAKIDDYISIVLCSFTHMGQASLARTPGEGAKDGELQFTAELLLRHYTGPKVHMWLMDDDDRNFPSKNGPLSARDSKVQPAFIRARETPGEDGTDEHIHMSLGFIEACSRTPAPSQAATSYQQPSTSSGRSGASQGYQTYQSK